MIFIRPRAAAAKGPAKPFGTDITVDAFDWSGRKPLAPIEQTNGAGRNVTDSNAGHSEVKGNGIFCEQTYFNTIFRDVKISLKAVFGDCRFRMTAFSRAADILFCRLARSLKGSLRQY